MILWLTVNKINWFPFFIFFFNQDLDCGQLECFVFSDLALSMFKYMLFDCVKACRVPCMVLQCGVDLIVKTVLQIYCC
jgi:hypothetical protein